MRTTIRLYIAEIEVEIVSSCTFFGHRECWELDAGRLCGAIEELIQQGVDTFYVGNQGGFDAMVYSCLKGLRKA